MISGKFYYKDKIIRYKLKLIYSDDIIKTITLKCTYKSSLFQIFSDHVYLKQFNNLTKDFDKNKAELLSYCNDIKNYTDIILLAKRSIMNNIDITDEKLYNLKNTNDIIKRFNK